MPHPHVRLGAAISASGRGFADRAVLQWCREQSQSPTRARSFCRLTCPPATCLRQTSANLRCSCERALRVSLGLVESSLCADNSFQIFQCCFVILTVRRPLRVLSI